MKKIFVVFVVEENGKRCAYADAIQTGNNLVPILKNHYADICHLCESRKEADETAHVWNEVYKKENRYLYN